MKNKIIISLSLDDETVKQLDNIAIKYKVSRSAALRIALSNFKP